MEITVAGVRKRLDRGTWECNGNDNFKIVAGGLLYTSNIDDWVESTTESEPLSPETPTTNTNQSIFPLKKGKSGPEVVQLQNFLNDKVTDEKLVTDGIFGDLTYNKLVKYQKDNNLI
jgi:peptidoglycan hydrolase-like protein with peptidoglycan-binding domain